MLKVLPFTSNVKINDSGISRADYYTQIIPGALHPTANLHQLACYLELGLISEFHTQVGCSYHKALTRRIQDVVWATPWIKPPRPILHHHLGLNPLVTTKGKVSWPQEAEGSPWWRGIPALLSSQLFPVPSMSTPLRQLLSTLVSAFSVMFHHLPQ